MSNVNINNIESKTAGMNRYLRMFFLWLKTDKAKDAPASMDLKWEAFWRDRGLPAGWEGPADKPESATRNFFTDEGGDRILRLKALFEEAKESDDYAVFDDAVADAVRDELGVKDEDLEQEEDVAKLPKEAVDHITDRFTAVQ